MKQSRTFGSAFRNKLIKVTCLFSWSPIRTISVHAGVCCFDVKIKPSRLEMAKTISYFSFELGNWLAKTGMVL